MEFRKMVTMTLYARQQKRHRCKNRLLDSVGEGKDGMIWENSVETCLFSSVQLLSHVWLFVTPWTAACQASLSITNSWSLPKLMSVESVMPSNHLILCPPLLLLPSIFPFQASGSFPMSQLFVSGGQSIGVSASSSVLPMNTQDWYCLISPNSS